MAEIAGGVVFRTGKTDSGDNESNIWDDTALIKAYDKAINSFKASQGGNTSNQGAADDEISDGKNRNKRGRRPKKYKKKKKNKWKIGDQCQAVFTEDGHVYDAVIKSVNYKMGTGWVTYVGYGNEEEKKLVDLMAAAEINDASPARRTQLSENEYDSMDCTQSPYPDRPSSRCSQQHHHTQHHQQYNGGPAYHPGWYPPSPHYSPFPPPPPPPVWAMAHQSPQLHPSAAALPTGFPFLQMSQPASVSMGLPAVPPPPAPDVDDADESGMHSMLMSWYMSGYHTGYYQGLRQGKRLATSAAEPKRQRPQQPATGNEAVNQKPKENHHVPSDSNNTDDDTR